MATNLKSAAGHVVCRSQWKGPQDEQRVLGGGKARVGEVISLEGRTLCGERLRAGLGLDRVPPTLGC